MNTNQSLAEKMAEKADQQLLDMFAKPTEWTPEALDAAQTELHKRNVITQPIFSQDRLRSHNATITKRAERIPSKPVLIFACCILGAFFMPWFQLFGVAATGYNLGQLGSYGNYAWIVPILSGATILLSLNGYNNRGVGAFTGIVPLAAIIYGIVRLVSEGGGDALRGVSEVVSHVLSVGAYVTIICSIGIIIAAEMPAPPNSDEKDKNA